MEDANTMAAVIQSMEEKTMTKATAITGMFLDIGGVVQSNKEVLC